jgi:hypothetical protein
MADDAIEIFTTREAAFRLAAELVGMEGIRPTSVDDGEGDGPSHNALVREILPGVEVARVTAEVMPGLSEAAIAAVLADIQGPIVIADAANRQDPLMLKGDLGAAQITDALGRLDVFG